MRLGHDGITRVSTGALSLCTEPWAFAVTYADAIEAHWQARLQTNPGFFNGVIYLLREASIDQTPIGNVLTATFYQTDFKSFLYWREQGYPPAQARDCFGSAILRSAEGHVLLGRQTAGNMNAGLAYLPGGFIDERDCAPDGSINIVTSIARELTEETGICINDLTTGPDLRIISCGPLLSIAREFRSALPATRLREQILAHLATEANPELSDIVIITGSADLEDASVPPYTAMAIRDVLTDPFA